MMHRTYGRRGAAPQASLFSRKAKLDLSSSISDTTSISNCSSNEKENERPKCPNRRPAAGNKTTNKRTTRKKQTDAPVEDQPTEKHILRRRQECEVFRNVPDFKELEDYKLVVIPVTPIKTHITTSESTEGDPWDPQQFRSPVPFSPVFRHSSPHVTSHNVSTSSKQSAHSMETRRMKRLRARMSPSAETSTPDGQQRKLTRLSTSFSSPAHLRHLSVIEHQEELCNSFQMHVSLDESAHVEPMRMMFDDQDSDSQLDSVSYSQIQVIVKTESTGEKTMNMFSDASHYRTAPSLPEIDEEEFISSEESDSSVKSERRSKSSHSPVSNTSSIEPIYRYYVNTPRAYNNKNHTAHTDDSHIHSAVLSHTEDGNVPTGDSHVHSEVGHAHTDDSYTHSEVTHAHTAYRHAHSEVLSHTEDGNVQTDDSHVRSEVSHAHTDGSYTHSESSHAHIKDDQCSSDLKSFRPACLSDDSLILQFQQLKSPTLAELASQGRQKSILRKCGQSRLLSWTSYFRKRHIGSDDLIKLGEGVYGEVFRFVDHQDQQTIIKVVPMGGDCTVNEEPQKSFKEMLNEIKVTSLLSDDVGLNFIKMKSAWCTKGSYPDTLLSCWDRFNESKTSENDRPDYFTDDQAYCVFEFCNGGIALESFQFQSTMQSISVLLQVGWSLAAAEAKFDFEHRDLHWGNILIKITENESISYKLEGLSETHHLQTHGAHVNLIDFTLARLQHQKEVIFTDLSTDETLFQGYGDYQFDVYRQMKDLNRDDWRSFNAQTNVFWMKYVADKLMAVPCSKTRMKLSLKRRNKELTEFIKRCDSYNSAVQMVLTDELFLAHTEEECDISAVSDGY